MSVASAARCYNTECPVKFVESAGTLCHYYDKCDRFKPSEEMRKANEEIERQKETVNHPQHYQGKYECIELMQAMFGEYELKVFCKLNAFKYRFRAGKKEGSSLEEDLAKAEWYENKYMELHEECLRVYGK